MADSSFLVRCTGLRIGRHGRAILPPIDLTIAPGEVIVIAGRNGSGKTTFVETLLGILPPVGGTIERRADLRLAYLPQVGTIDAGVPVRVQELVGWGTQRGWSFLAPRKRTDAAAIERGLDDAQIRDLARRRYGELSGGQRQRTLLARLLAATPELAVLDEPTAAMDARAEQATFERLHDLAHERSLAALLVTHEIAVAACTADRIAFFDPDGDGVTIGRSAEIAALPGFIHMFGRVELEAAHARP